MLGERLTVVRVMGFSERRPSPAEAGLLIERIDP